MRVMQALSTALCALAVFACGQRHTEEEVQKHGNTPPAEIHGGSSLDTVLSVLGRDTVTLETVTDTTRIVWLTNVGHQVVRRWESGPTYGATPMIELEDFNGDSIPDLFWTLRYEEILAGMVLFGTSMGARPVFVTTDDACRLPEVRDINNDGRPDVISYEPGALPLDECRGDPLAEPCQRAYPTEWAVPWIQHADSFVNQPSLAKSFYSDRAKEYEAGADTLRERLARGGNGVPSPRCDARLASAIDSLAVRARRIAQLK